MSTQAVQTKTEQAIVPLRQAIEDGISRNWQSLIAAVSGDEAKAKRYQTLLITAVARNPKLAECDPGSLVLSTIEAAQLDLEFGAKKHGYLIPYKDKASGTIQCSFRPGYLGLAHAAKRSGAVKEVRAEVVCEKDEFQYELGASKRINFHRPATSDRGKFACVYAVAIFPDGSYDFEVLSPDQIESAKKRSATSGADTPWQTDFEEMAKKTAIRKLCKRLPMDDKAADAMELDGRYEIEATPAPAMQMPKEITQ